MCGSSDVEGWHEAYELAQLGVHLYKIDVHWRSGFELRLFSGISLFDPE